LKRIVVSGLRYHFR